MKSDFEILEEYIDYRNERDIVDGLGVVERALYKCMIRDTFSFLVYKLRVRFMEFIKNFINSFKKEKENK